MLRGLFAGGGVGLVVAALAMVLASVMAPLPRLAPEPLETAPPGEVAALPETPGRPAQPAAQPALPQIGAPATAPTQQLPADEVASAPGYDRAPASAPRTDAVADRPAAPEGAARPELAGNVEAPVQPGPPAMAPAEPAADTEIVVATEPGAPRLPAPTVATPAEAAPEAPAASIEVPPAAARPAPETPPRAGDAVAAADPDGAPTPPTAPVETDGTAEGSAEGRVVVRGEAAGLPSGASEVVVNRAVPAAPAEAPAQEPVAAAVTDPAAPPLRRHAARFANPDDLPLLSVVLIDDGSLEGAPAAVAAIGMPLTVAIAPGRPDAQAAMAAYRERGIEVAVLPTLPAGAAATDVEVTLEAALADVPEAVALVDATGAWQAGGGVAEQALARLGDEGRGFVTISSGLNAGLRAAAVEDVPAALVYRDLDGNGQDARVIRRFVDQAAFRARQTSGVVLLGRVRPETISALTLWSTANRAGQVAMAPLSAVLLASAD